MNYFGLPSPLLPASLHDQSRQLQEPSIAKIHRLNGTTVPPDMPDPQPSDDARCWYKLVMCRQGWLLMSFSHLDSKYHHLRCTKPRTVMTGLNPLSLDRATISQTRLMACSNRASCSRNNFEGRSIHGHPSITHNLMGKRIIPKQYGSPVKDTQHKKRKEKRASNPENRGRT